MSPAWTEGNNCSWRPPDDDFEQANTAAAEPNIAGHDNGIIKLIILKYATLMLTQKTQHPFHNVGSQNTVLCTETRSCSSGIYYQG